MIAGHFATYRAGEASFLTPKMATEVPSLHLYAHPPTAFAVEVIFILAYLVPSVVAIAAFTGAHAALLRRRRPTVAD